jgi:hypothetical protein
MTSSPIFLRSKQEKLKKIFIPSTLNHHFYRAGINKTNFGKYPWVNLSKSSSKQ